MRKLTALFVASTLALGAANLETKMLYGTGICIPLTFS